LVFAEYSFELGIADPTVAAEEANMFIMEGAGVEDTKQLKGMEE
jgi:hypothetical protein